MGVHRFRWDGVRDDLLIMQVEPTLLAGPPAVQPEIDITLVDDTMLSDLVIAMDEQGWSFVSSSPAGPPLSIVGSGSLGWTTLYDIDWTAQANLNIKPNASVVIDGKTWTTENGANSATFDVVNGTGIVFTSISGNAGNYGDNVRTATLFRTDLSGLIPDFGFGSYFALRILCRILITNADTNFEFMKFGLEHAGAPATMNMLAGYGFAGVLGTQNGISTTTLTQRDSATATADNVIGLIYKPPFICDFLSAPFVGPNFPVSYTQRSSWAGGMSTGITANVIRNVTANNLRLVLSAQATGAVSTFTATFIRTRVEGIKLL